MENNATETNQTNQVTTPETSKEFRARMIRKGTIFCTFDANCEGDPKWGFFYGSTSRVKHVCPVHKCELKFYCPWTFSMDNGKHVMPCSTTQKMGYVRITTVHQHLLYHWRYENSARKLKLNDPAVVEVVVSSDDGNEEEGEKKRKDQFQQLDEILEKAKNLINHKNELERKFKLVSSFAFDLLIMDYIPTHDSVSGYGEEIAAILTSDRDLTNDRADALRGAMIIKASNEKPATTKEKFQFISKIAFDFLITYIRDGDIGKTTGDFDRALTIAIESDPLLKEERGLQAKNAFIERADNVIARSLGTEDDKDDDTNDQPLPPTMQSIDQNKRLIYMEEATDEIPLSKDVLVEMKKGERIPVHQILFPNSQEEADPATEILWTPLAPLKKRRKHGGACCHCGKKDHFPIDCKLYKWNKDPKDDPEQIG